MNTHNTMIWGFFFFNFSVYNNNIMKYAVQVSAQTRTMKDYNKHNKIK